MKYYLLYEKLDVYCDVPGVWDKEWEEFDNMEDAVRYKLWLEDKPERYRDLTITLLVTQ